MKRLFALLAALTLSLNLGGCGEEDDGSGGNFFAVIAENPKNLDPQLAEDSSSFFVIKNIYATLTDIDSEGGVVNGAAASVTVSEDGKIYTFKLRGGLFWQGQSSSRGDMLPLTAYDYEYAFRRIYTPETHSPHKEIFSCIRGAMDYYEGHSIDLGVYAQDENTLKIELAAPDCDFLRLLSHPAASPCNEKLFSDTRGRYGLSAEDTFCCGAFYVADWNYDPYWTENRIILERISANSQTGYRTYPHSVHIEISDSRADAELKNNALCEGYAAKSFDEYTKDVSREYNIKEYFCGTSFLMFPPESVIGKNTGARQALAAVIDREKAAGNWGEGSKTAEGVFPPQLICGGTSIRDICGSPDNNLNAFSPRIEWNEFTRENSGVDFNSFFLLVSDDYPSPKAVESIVEDFERELDFYCTPVYESPSDYRRRAEAGDCGLRIETVYPGFGTVSNFAALAARASGNADESLNSKTAALSHGANVSEKGAAAADFEETFISGAYALPISWEAKYFISRKDSEDLWYDPYTDVVFYKYAKKYGD